MIALNRIPLARNLWETRYDCSEPVFQYLIKIFMGNTLNKEKYRY